MFLILFFCSLAAAELLCSTCGLEGVPKCGPGGLLTEIRAFQVGNTSILTKRIMVTQVESSNGTQSFQCSTEGIRSADCEKQCLSGTRKCDGDKAYCQKHDCQTSSDRRRSSIRCDCRERFYTTKTIGTAQNGSSYEGTVIDCAVKIGAQAARKRNTKRDAGMTTEVFISLESDTLNINVVPTTAVTVRLAAAGWTTLFSTSNSSFRYQLPDPIRSVDAILTVEVWSSAGLLREREFTIQRQMCTVKNNCVVCLEVFDNWACVPTTIKTLIVFLAVLAFILVASLIPVVAWIVGSLVYFAQRALMAIFRIGANAHRTRMARYIADKAKVVGEALEYDEEAAVEAVEPARPRKVVIGGRTFFVALVLLALPLALACDSSTVGSFTSTSCTTDTTGKETCEVGINARFSLAVPGVTSCVKYATSSGNQLHVELKWVKMVELIVPAFEYWTRDWEGQTYSSTSCPGTDHCDLTGGDDCTDMQSNNIDAYGQLVGQFIQNPGRSTCQEGTAHPFSCFFVAATCMYSRWVIVPKGPQFSVLSAGTHVRVATLNVVMRSEQELLANQTFELTKFGGIISVDLLNSGGIQFDVRGLGEFQDETSIEPLKGIVHDHSDDTLYEGLVSKRGAPVKRQVGDIQQANFGMEIQTQTENVDAFLFDDDVMQSARVVDHSIMHTFQPSGISVSLPNLRKFPVEVSGNIWHKSTPLSVKRSEAHEALLAMEERKRQFSDAFVLQANIANPGGIEVEFDTFSSDLISISQVVNSVCPSIRNLTISGCLNCASAPTVSFMARSTCQAGGANPYITTAGYTTLTGLVSLSTAFQLFEVKFQAQASTSVSFELCLGADSRFDCANVTGTLTTMVFNMTNNLNTGNSTSNMSSSGAGEFFGAIGAAFEAVFSGLGSALDYVKVVATLVVGLIVTGLVVGLALKLVKLRSATKVKSV